MRKLLNISLVVLISAILVAANVSEGWHLFSLFGLIFFLLGLKLYFSLFPLPSAFPLLFFHFFAGIFFTLTSFERLPMALDVVRSFSLAFAPVTFLHFALIQFEVRLTPGRERFLYASLYSLSLIFGILQIIFPGHERCSRWASLLVVLIAAGVCVKVLLKGQRRFERIVAGFILGGIFLGFTVPFLVSSDTWVPLILFFPLLFLIGLFVAKRSQSQSYRIQSAKRSSFSEFLSGLTHELNNPLNYIYATMNPYKERLKKLKEKLPTNDPEATKIFQELEKMTSTIEEGAKRATNLVESFRHYPSGEVRGEKEAVDLNKIVEQTVELLSPKWKGRLLMEVFLDPVGTIRGYSGELAQVFTNIIANACDATPDKGTVSVSTHKGSSGVKILVKDTGKGIPREQIGKIFDPFFTTKEPQQGTGLGLSISLQIIKSHKGSIEVNSVVGKGTEVLITLPYG